jgi:CBS domain-containing protein
MSRDYRARPFPEGSFRSPSFEHAWVADAMRPGVFSCSAETPIRTVAQMMAQHHIHSVVITDVSRSSGEQAWGIVSDVDVLRAADAGDLDEGAGGIAATEFLTVGPQERLSDAVQLMASHEVTHVVVGDEESGRPIGVLSTLDVAGVIAWGTSLRPRRSPPSRAPASSG